MRANEWSAALLVNAHETLIAFAPSLPWTLGGTMTVDLIDAQQVVAAAGLVEQLAKTDAPAAIDALARLELQVDRYIASLDREAIDETRLVNFRRLVSSLRSSLGDGHVRSLTGLQRQVRLLTLQS